MFVLIGLLYVVLVPYRVTGQTRNSESGIQPLKFSEVWVWEYTDICGKTAEMAIYRDPRSNSWLLTSEAYGNTDEMCDWILAKPGGTYYMAYQSPELNNKRYLVEVKHEVVSAKSLPEHWSPLGEYKYFGNKLLGFPRFKGRKYRVSYLKTNDVSTYYVENTKTDFTAIYTFNDLEIDAKLPIRFPKDVPPTIIVLNENSVFSNVSVSYSFKYISQAEYYIDISEYQPIGPGW